MTRANEFYLEGFAIARQRFLTAASTVGARVSSVEHPKKGPSGERLATDFAWLGRPDAKAVCLVLSGAHGIEGHCGSLIQSEWLERGESKIVPDDVAILMIHAINPYGFAWARRGDHENIDLNRNWVDFSKPIFANSAYHLYTDILHPDKWDEAAQSSLRAALAGTGESGGGSSFFSAATSGQYHHPTGLFYGGRSPSWSRRLIEDALPAYLGNCIHLAVVDIHTGLGPSGFGELLVAGNAADSILGRARRWFGINVLRAGGQESSTEAVTGDFLSALPSLLPDAEVTAVAVEFGTVPVPLSLQALVGDSWLHSGANQDRQTILAVKKAMFDSFYPHDPVWRGMALGQGLSLVRKAVCGLKHSLSE